MTWAKTHVNELDLAALTRITAGQQTGGKGQFDRSWHSPPGNLYVTFCFTAPTGWPHLPHAAQVLALSAAKVLEGYDLKPALKWPNDILLSEKKISGVLCEVETLPDRLLLINGIGLNISLTEADCKEIDQPVTSLAIELKRPVEVNDVIEKLTVIYRDDLDSFLREGFAPFKEAIEEKLKPTKAR